MPGLYRSTKVMYFRCAFRYCTICSVVSGDIAVCDDEVCEGVVGDVGDGDGDGVEEEN